MRRVLHPLQGTLIRSSSLHEIVDLMTTVKRSPLVEVGIQTTQIELTMLAKALAHPARVQIIETLMRRNTCIGCDIVEEIGLAASTTSEHLRILKAAGIITGEIERPRVRYSLNHSAVLPLLSFLNRVAESSRSKSRSRKSR